MYKTYQPALVNFAYFYLKNEQEAIDTVQELFLNIWEKRDAFPDTDTPKAYLMTAIKYRCYNKLARSNKNQNPLNTLEEVFITEDTTMANMEARETETNIKTLINTLPHKCKEIFILSRFEHLSYKEIATMLDISVKTVENQIGNALKMLRKNILNLLLLTFSMLQNILKNT